MTQSPITLPTAQQALWAMRKVRRTHERTATRLRANAAGRTRATTNAIARHDEEIAALDAAIKEMEAHARPPAGRYQTIVSFLEASMERAGAAASAWPRERFLAEAPMDPTMLHRPYGWMPPISGVLIFCPDLIETQTKALDADELDDYLNTISLAACLHLAHGDQPPEVREAMIFDALVTTSPHGLKVAGRVQMATMDAARAGELVALVCVRCKGARFVCEPHPWHPWHPGHDHCGASGTACPDCNPVGEDTRSWNLRCLGCATPAEFADTQDDDTDVGFHALTAGLTLDTSTDTEGGTP